MASTVSRRVSEFAGVLLFAAALIWIIALASYEPADPVWFFSAGSHAAPANFAGRVGAFLAELSFQVFGYGSYLIPVVLVITGWNYFWCRSLDAAATKAAGAALLIAGLSAFLSLVFRTLDVSGKAFRAGGYAGELIAGQLSEYLNRSGSVIVILTLIFLAIIMSTQFSFGRFTKALLAAGAGAVRRGYESFRERREERRREQQRREVIEKHVRKAAPEIRKPIAPGDAGRRKRRVRAGEIRSAPRLAPKPQTRRRCARRPAPISRRNRVPGRSRGPNQPPSRPRAPRPAPKPRTKTPAPSALHASRR